MRGGKKIDTKSRFISNGRAQFNERFSMKTVLNYDDNSGEYEPKPVILYIFANILYSLSCKLSLSISIIQNWINVLEKQILICQGMEKLEIYWRD